MKINRRAFFQKGAVLGAGLALGSSGLLAERKDSSLQSDEHDIFEVIKNRRSVRKFKSTPIPKEHLTKILEAANSAPTPSNRQAWKFFVIQERKTLDQIKEACIKRSGERSRQYFTDYLSAPVYVVVLANTKTRNPVNDITAGALAAENLMLAARALGYGTVFCANSIREEVTKEVLNIPDDYKRICITPIGVPVEWPKTPEKKSLEDVVLYERF
ncbi:MAG: nitroreductase family protein [Candidatus Aminicenantes bacterium]|nr:MAG: nitroreductase family protein [Candidatus Aminicenantes bacterium]